MGDLLEGGSSRPPPQRPKKLAKATNSRASSTAGHRSESGARTFLCKADDGCGCGKAFGRQAELTRHVRTIRRHWAFVCLRCKGKRKCYISVRKEHLYSHLRRIHKEEPPENLEAYWRHLTEEEQEDRRNSRRGRTSSSGAAASSHLSPSSAATSQAISSTSSEVSRSPEPSSSFAKRSRASTPPKLPATKPVKGSHILYGDDSSENARMRARFAVDTRDEVDENSRARMSALEPDLDREDIKSLFRYAWEKRSIKTVHPKPMKWMEQVWEAKDKWSNISSSSSSRSSRSSRRAAMKVSFAAPSRQGSGATSHVKPAGPVSELVGSYLDNPVNEDHWNALHAARRGKQREVIVISDDDI